MLDLKKGFCTLKLDLSFFLAASFGQVKGIVSFYMWILRSDGWKNEMMSTFEPLNSRVNTETWSR